MGHDSVIPLLKKIFNIGLEQSEEGTKVIAHI
jgi:hypothetical protein